jgi:hypothetical protein
VKAPDALAVARVQAMLHQSAVSANRAAFHVGVPADFASYVYRYLDGAGALVYVGMTSNATWRAGWHWDHSDWVSWGASVKYTRCHSRDEAFKLETKVRDDEQPLFHQDARQRRLARRTGSPLPRQPCDRRMSLQHA